MKIHPRKIAKITALSLSRTQLLPHGAVLSMQTFMHLSCVQGEQN